MRELNFHHLFYFWTVAKEGHLTRAAQQLHVSQSALSSQIKQLEERLGQDLFVREGRSLKLTEFGHVVLNYAERIFNLSQEMMSMVERGDTHVVQTFRVGAVATLSRNFQENFLRPILGSPNIQLTLLSASLEQLLEQLSMHKLDLILSNRAVASDFHLPIRCQCVAQQSVSLIGPNTEVLQGKEFPRDLDKVPVLVPGVSSDIRTQFDMYCEENNLQITPYAEVDDMAMLRVMSRSIQGVAVVPEVVVQDELRAGVLKKYCTLEGVVEKFYAITAKREFESTLISTLLN